MSAAVEDMLRVARGTLGIREDPPGSNRTLFGEWFGLDGAPWCSIWLSWVADKAGHSDAVPKQASVQARLDAARKAGQLTRDPRSGDLAAYQFDGDPQADHIGLIEHVNPDGSFVAIEANTSPGAAGSQANGGGVYRRTRTRAVVAAYIRPPYTEDDDMPLTDAEKREIAELTRDAILRTAYGREPNRVTLGALLGETWAYSRQAAGHSPEALAVTVADAVIARLPAPTGNTGSGGGSVTREVVRAAVIDALQGTARLIADAPRT